MNDCPVLTDRGESPHVKRILCHIMKAINGDDVTERQMNQMLHMKLRRLKHYLDWLHDHREIHIVNWNEDELPRASTPVYRQGDGPDAPRRPTATQLQHMLDKGAGEYVPPVSVQQLRADQRERRLAEVARAAMLQACVPHRDWAVSALFGDPTDKEPAGP